MGSKSGAQDEQPQYVETFATMRMDQHEVTVEAYQACVDAGACTPAGTDQDGTANDPKGKNKPINCVDLEQAKTFCEWIGRRVPTEQQWEHAAAGSTERPYPWGKEEPNNSR